MLTTRLTLIIGLALIPSMDIAEEVKDQPLEILDEVLVTGTQPGPPLWQVKSGTNVVWVLAQLRTIAKDITWRSKQVEGVLANAQEVLVVYGSGDTPEYARPTVSLPRKEIEALLEQTRILPRGQTLRDILPSDLYARFQNARVAFPSRDKNRNNDMDSYTPDWARNTLGNRASAALGLGLSPVTDKVVDMAEKRRVKVTVIEPLIWSRFLPVPKIESAMDMCPLDQLLQTLEGRGSRIVARANAWAVGDVERLQQMLHPLPPRVSGCESRDVDVTAIKEKWLAAMEGSLAKNSNTLAVVDASLLLSANSLLDALRSRGYEVVEP